MSRLIFFIAEGETEAEFVDKVLSEYLIKYDICVDYMTLGGNISFDRLKEDATKILKNRKDCWKITTMIDLYGLKNIKKFPGYDEKLKDYKLVEKLESELKKFFNDNRFIPYFSLHEFEALLFSNVNAFKDKIPSVKDDDISKLSNKLKKYKSNPELINQNKGPSKHIEEIIIGYNKVVHGKELCKKIGIDTIKKNCKHFNDWIEKLI